MVIVVGHIAVIAEMSLTVRLRVSSAQSAFKRSSEIPSGLYNDIPCIDLKELNSSNNFAD